MACALGAESVAPTLFKYRRLMVGKGRKRLLRYYIDTHTHTRYKVGNSLPQMFQMRIGPD